MIGIGLLTLVPGALGGSETYVRGLLQALAEGGELDYTVFAPPVAPEAGAGLPTVVVDEYRTARTIPQRLQAMTWAAARSEPLRRRFAAADAVHFPLTIALPRVEAPAAVTLHDVQHLDLPEMFPRAERMFRTVAWHSSLRRARLVIVPSAFVRDRAVERLGLDAAKLRVIPHGIDHGLFRPSDNLSQGDGAPFLLYPAKGWPHKNHARLLEAFALLRRERPELRLVLTGGAGQPPREGVEHCERVSLEELAELYRGASALVFPSLYEGFGQPPLEAMASGCPVACSNAASLPEVVGDAARLFDPESPEEIATAVAEVLDDPEPWRERGLARAAAFSWARSAREHEQAYLALLADRP
ncbi:MAG: glycosyltransferase family 4 protein [Gaiellaceae bacterium]